MFIDFLKKKNAVAALEIAMILPIFLILIMGIIEFSIIFSIRSGMEEISRAFGKWATAKLSGIQFAAAAGVTYEKGLINWLHERTTNIVLKPGKLRLCIEVRPTLVGITNITNNQINNCKNFSNNRNVKPNQFFNINDGQYALVTISYKHEYLTPLGGLISTLGYNVTFTSIAYLKKE
jgi:hypothetical protein